MSEYLPFTHVSVTETKKTSIAVTSRQQKLMGGG